MRTVPNNKVFLDQVNKKISAFTIILDIIAWYTDVRIILWDYVEYLGVR